MSEKPEGVETWRVAMDRYGGAVICADPSPEKLRSLSYDEVAYCLHAAQRLPVVERERDEWRGRHETAVRAAVSARLERDAAQARIAILEEALRPLARTVLSAQEKATPRPHEHDTIITVTFGDILNAKALLSKETDR